LHSIKTEIIGQLKYVFCRVITKHPLTFCTWFTTEKKKEKKEEKKTEKKRRKKKKKTDAEIAAIR